MAEDLLAQDFTTPQAPNEVWLSDLTYIPTMPHGSFRGTLKTE
jgi:transposase InsO family protein